MRRPSFVALFSLTACASNVAPPPECPPPTPTRTQGPPLREPVRTVAVDDVAQEIVRRFNARDAEGVHELYDPAMKEDVPIDEQRTFIEKVLGANGRLGVLRRTNEPRNAYHGEYVLEAEHGEWRMILDVDGHGQVRGLSMKAAPPPDPPVAKNTIPIALPFKGEWRVVWGGDTPRKNRHVIERSQRRAADLVKVDAAGKTHEGDGKKNEDYYCYGQEVLAVADGVVTMAIDGVPENEPGFMNRYFALGNAVIVKHTDDLYSFYAHLQSGKLRVKVGSKVKRGDVLGLTGNSGNSSEPHLHFQLQDGPRLEASWGVEPFFSNVEVTRDGKKTREASYTFLRGDRVAP